MNSLQVAIVALLITFPAVSAAQSGAASEQEAEPPAEEVAVPAETEAAADPESAADEAAAEAVSELTAPGDATSEELPPPPAPNPDNPAQDTAPRAPSHYADALANPNGMHSNTTVAPNEVSADGATVPDGYGDSVWDAFTDANRDLAEGRTARGERKLRAIRELYPEHPASERVEFYFTSRRERPIRRDENREHRLARADLASWQGAYGAWIGTWICVAAECDEPRPWAGLILGGMGLGIGLSVLGSRGQDFGIRKSTTYNLMARWGMLYSWSIAAATGIAWTDDDDGFGTPTGHIAALLSGYVIGMGSAALVARYLEPSAGDIALMDSFSLLANTTATLLFGAVGFETRRETQRVMPGIIAVTGALGLTLGGVLTKYQTFSRKRALLLDISSGAGIGSAMLLAFLIRGNEITPEALFGAGTAGALAGFTVSYILSRNMRPGLDAPPVQISAGPIERGGMAQLTVTLR